MFGIKFGWQKHINSEVIDEEYEWVDEINLVVNTAKIEKYEFEHVWNAKQYSVFRFDRWGK